MKRREQDTTTQDVRGETVLVRYGVKPDRAA
jgi:hypothetical protein